MSNDTHQRRIAEMRDELEDLVYLIENKHVATRNACAVRAQRLRVALDLYIADLEDGWLRGRR